MEMINTWQFNLIGYLVFVVIFTQGYKLAVRNARHDGAATVLLQLVAGFSTLLLFPLFDGGFPTNIAFWTLMIIACVFYAANDRLQTTARKHLPVSTYSVVSPISNVFLIIIGLIIFKEALVINKILGMTTIVGANIFLFYKKGEFKVNKYIWTAVAAALAFAIAISIDIGTSVNFNLPFYIMFTLVIPAIMLILIERIKFSQIIEEYNSDSRKFYVLTAVAWGVAIIFSLRAFRFGEVTTIVPLHATSVILNVLFAYMFLNEKGDRFKKIIAASVVMAGVYLTVL